LSTVKARSHSDCILISAAEPSGDCHAAHLVQEAGARRSDLRFAGFGGPKLKAAGCAVEADLTAVASMALGFVAHLGHYASVLRTFDRLLGELRPQAVVLVDSPGLHFLFARLARWRGVPVVYYICPQIWAWAPWRRGKVLRWTDLLMTILPFEVDLYRNSRVPVRFVGHPLADELTQLSTESGAALREELGLRPADKLIGLFPGSRRSEVVSLMPHFCRLLERADLDAGCSIVAVSSYRPEFDEPIRSACGALKVPWRIVPEDARPLMMACDLAVVASGTASLELAFFRRPMVVLYHASSLARAVFAQLRVTPWIALPNILGSSVNRGPTVPELLFSREIPAQTAGLLHSLLDEGPERRDAIERLDRLRKTVFQPGGVARAAETLLAFLDVRAVGQKERAP
jgi:lipid-A-disaccharide synthase